MQAPDFWNKCGIASTLLYPFSLFYTLGGYLRQALSTPEKVSVPVICIGNLSAGGSGKTPVTLSIAEELTKMGLSPHIISRGYGGSELGPLRVELGKHLSDQVGDEPLMMAKAFPTWISRDRVKGAKAAIDGGADILLLDDGFQNPSLAKDLSLIVVDNKLGFSNCRVIPAGPLRESISSGLKRADAVVLIKDTKSETDKNLLAKLAGTTILQASTVPFDDTLSKEIAGKSVFAFAGIGYPKKFYDTLEKLGANLCGTKDFPDHYKYSHQEIIDLIKSAKELGADMIMTTEKDAVKLPADSMQEISALPIRTVWDKSEALKAVLNNVTGTK